jgi:hypothetical protein
LVEADTIKLVPLMMPIPDDASRLGELLKHDTRRDHKFRIQNVILGIEASTDEGQASWE